MARKPFYLAVVGPGEDAKPANIADARDLGALAAKKGWIVVTGGRNAGVMAAAAEGVKSVNGTALGLLPGFDRADAAPALTASLPTGLGEARNVVLVNSVDALAACGMNPGTLSEVALALRARKPTVLVRPDKAAAAMLASIGDGAWYAAPTPLHAITWLSERR